MAIKIIMDDSAKGITKPEAKPLSHPKIEKREEPKPAALPLINKKEDKSHDELANIIKELDSLIGLKEVKALIHEVHSFVEVQHLREAADLAHDSTVLHAIFKGNPGTGKTTVARLLAKLYKEMGVLEKGHLVEVERADLVGEYIGHTAQKTKEQVNKAIGGVLFIDEAYSLCRGGEKDFGREAIDALVKAMEDKKNSFILILAGYNDEMIQFLASNPGLNSRFPLHIQFPDYNLSELMDIADMMFAQRQYKPDADAKNRLRAYIGRILEIMPASHGNARTVRNIVEASMRAQAVRLMKTKKTKYDRAELQQINVWDINQSVMKIASAMQATKEAQDKERAKEKDMEAVKNLESRLKALSS